MLPHTQYSGWENRILETEKKVKVLTEQNILGVDKFPGGQSCMEKNAGDIQSPWLPKTRLGCDEQQHSRNQPNFLTRIPRLTVTSLTKRDGKI